MGCIGVAISTVAIPPLVKFLDLSGDIEKAIEAGKKRFDDFNASVEKQIELRSKLRDISTMGNQEDVRGRLTESDQTLADLNTQIQAIDRNALGPQARLDQLRQAIGPQLLQDIIGGGATGFAARRVGELAFRGVPGEPNTSFGQAVTEAQGLIAELGKSETDRAEIISQIRELNLTRQKLGEQFARLSESQAETDSAAGFEQVARMAQERDRARSRAARQLEETTLDLEIARAQRDKQAQEAARKPNDRMEQLQLQKLDQQIRLLQEVSSKLSETAVTGISGE